MGGRGWKTEEREEFSKKEYKPKKYMYEKRREGKNISENFDAYITTTERKAESQREKREDKKKERASPKNKEGGRGGGSGFVGV